MAKAKTKPTRPKSRVDAKSKPVTKPDGKKLRKPPVAPAGATARKPAPAAKTALAPAKKTAPPEPVKKALAPAVQQKAPAKAAPKPTDAKPAAAPARPAAKIPVKPAIAPAVAKPVLPVVPRPQTPVMRLVPRMPGKILPRQFLFGLAQAIKDAVAPVARSLKGREIVSTAQTGDATFELDRVAEKALLTYLKNARAPIAYYSEDAGYSTFSNAQPKHLLVVDPVDGTRAAKSGFEGCVISVASTRVIERPTMADVDNACVMELLGDRTFYSERGAGARVYVQESVRKPKLSPNTNLERLTWTMTVPARPAELIFPTAARLIDLSSLKGGFFACNSTSYSLTRLLTNQVDACVDFAARYMKDIPDLVRDYFLNAGRGVVLGIAPYDFAAALLIAQEAGCVLTDAYGKVFDNVLLLDSSASNHQSLIAAASHDLHQKLLSFFDTRIRQFETLLARRAAAQAARRAAE